MTNYEQIKLALGIKRRDQNTKNFIAFLLKKGDTIADEDLAPEYLLGTLKYPDPTYSMSDDACGALINGCYIGLTTFNRDYCRGVWKPHEQWLPNTQQSTKADLYNALKYRTSTKYKDKIVQAFTEMQDLNNMDQYTDEEKVIAAFIYCCSNIERNIQDSLTLAHDTWEQVVKDSIGLETQDTNLTENQIRMTMKAF